MVGTPVTIRVALPGADELVVRGVAAMLASLPDQFELVTLRTQPPGGVDIALVEVQGVGAGATHLRRALNDPRIRRVAIYTWSIEAAAMESTGWGRIHGCLSKSLRTAELADALRSIHEGQFVVAAGSRSRPVVDSIAADPRAVLTTREEEVLARIATGVSNADIARQMGVTVNSVKSYIKSAYAKVGASSRSQAVLWVLTHELPAAAQTEAITE
ncbi:response regulator transcription factor [Nocardioides KLBMP 9356]|uniref:Response regulator transcription factor n=1 Tax=Nocardioides potassii TaxID=2911371 RepID=A0ABS9HDN4_9ACTN|nr:response regulator transcription factor [Nocardioides potassii]MCF6379305.1 response regulator transcription factor [Nocardioides potassii]